MMLVGEASLQMWYLSKNLKEIVVRAFQKSGKNKRQAQGRTNEDTASQVFWNQRGLWERYNWQELFRNKTINPLKALPLRNWKYKRWQNPLTREGNVIVGGNKDTGGLHGLGGLAAHFEMKEGFWNEPVETLELLHGRRSQRQTGTKRLEKEGCGQAPGRAVLRLVCLSTPWLTDQNAIHLVLLPKLCDWSKNGHIQEPFLESRSLMENGLRRCTFLETLGWMQGGKSIDYFGVGQTP